jgi:hypothetical protein
MVETGDQIHTFHVHEGVITSRSEYFKRALNKHWQTSGDRMVPLTEEDPHTLHMYLDLVYRGCLTLDQAGTAKYSCDAATVAQRYLVFADIDILADFLVDPSTKNNIIDTMLAQVRVNRYPCPWSGQYHLPGIEVINAIYSNILEGDGARKLLVELQDAYDANIADVRKWKDISPEFVDELTRLRRARGFSTRPWVRHFKLMRYHDMPQSRADRNNEDNERADE